MAHWRSTLSSQSGSQLGSSSSSSNTVSRRSATASLPIATVPSFVSSGGDLSIHISCSSDKVLFNGQSQVAGMLLWSINDSKQWQIKGRNYRSGYVIVKNLDTIPGAACVSGNGPTLAKLHTDLVGGSIPSCGIHTTGFVYNKGKMSWTAGTLDSSTGQWRSTRRVHPGESLATLRAYGCWVRSGRKETRLTRLPSP
eukprot:scpid76689/ scgid17861/ 